MIGVEMKLKIAVPSKGRNTDAQITVAVTHKAHIADLGAAVEGVRTNALNIIGNDDGSQSSVTHVKLHLAHTSELLAVTNAHDLFFSEIFTAAPLHCPPPYSITRYYMREKGIYG